MPERTPRDTGPKSGDSPNTGGSSSNPLEPQVIPKEFPTYAKLILVAAILTTVGVVLANLKH